MKLYKYPSNDELEVVLRRKEIESIDLEDVVTEVFENVKKDGDVALRALTLKYDAISLSSLEVSTEEMIEAETLVSLELKQAINLAAVNIEKFHSTQKETVVEVETMEGVLCWRKSVGIEKVGLYIPGGTAPLFSTVLMLGIPAKIAGCKEVILCTPPDKNGKVNAAILYAADLVGIKKIFKVRNLVI